MAVSTRTDEQYLAAEPGASAWVSANAGTGKTYVLVDRVIRIMLEGVAPERLLCLTFTKAAAAQMASRVHQALSHWVTLRDDELVEVIEASIGSTPDAEKLKLARTLFARALETPGGLKIQTVHAFAEALLRRFPLEASVSPHFEVLDEQIVQGLLAEARSRVLTSGAESADSDIAEAIEFLVGRLLEDRFDGLLNGLLSARGDLAEIFSMRDYEDVVAELYEIIDLPPGVSEASVLEDFCNPTNFDETALQNAVDVLANGSITEKKTADALQTWLAADDRPAASLKLMRYFVTKAKEGWRQKATSSIYSKKLSEADPALAALLDGERARALSAQRAALKAGVIQATSAALLVGQHILAEFAKLKTAAGGLDYNDLILKAGELLQAPDVAPWVLYKLDGGIDHILVDEAQDTSPDQWNIIWAIASEFFSGAGAHEDVSDLKRTVFAVGDEKQSIYRFQGADPAMFAAMNERFRQSAENAARRFEAVQLERSFRSTPEVLQVVDAVFHEAPAREGVMAEDFAMKHLPNRENEAGLVELWPAIQPDESVADDTPWHAPVDYVGKADPKVQLAVRLADQIDSWLKTGEQIGTPPRLLDPGDILILVQRRNDFFDAMIRELKAREIPVAGRDRMRLCEQLVVMDLIAIGKFALLPEDDLTLAVVLRSPICAVSEDELFELAHKRPGSLWQSLRRAADDSARFHDVVERLSPVLGQADVKRPFEFYSNILSDMGGRKNLIHRLGFDAMDPMDEFLARAIEYERNAVPTLQGFLNWFEKSDVEIKRDLEQERGEVRVMTVHGAKGLQAPIVILPDTCAVAGGRNDVRLLPASLPSRAAEEIPNMARLSEAKLPLWVPTRDEEDDVTHALREGLGAEDTEEYHRLLYVALTRAEDRLYICGFEGKNGRTKECWYDLVAPSIERLGKEITLLSGEVGFRLGEPPALSDKKQVQDDDQALALINPPNWVHRHAPEVGPMKRSLRPSHLVGEEPPSLSPLTELDDSRFERGRLIHSMLQNLPVVDRDKRQEIAAEFLERRKPDLDDDQRAALVLETLAVLNDPAFADVFGEGSLAEVPISGSVDGAAFYGLVDRLLVRNDDVLVVDFKTNRPPPETEAGINSDYIAQMAAYRAALQEIYPDHVIRVALLWTDGPTLMPISDDSLNEYAGLKENFSTS